MEAIKATAGAAGARNIAFEKSWEPVGNNLPCRFKVTTAPGNGLDVVLEQEAYRKSFTGTGSLTTSLVPVAPIGTKGKVIARDLVTGETAEQPWTWHIMGRSSGLWAMLMRMLGRS